MFVYIDSNDTADVKIIIIQDDGTITTQTRIDEMSNKLNVIEYEKLQ